MNTLILFFFFSCYCYIFRKNDIYIAKNRKKICLELNRMEELPYKLREPRMKFDRRIYTLEQNHQYITSYSYISKRGLPFTEYYYEETTLTYDMCNECSSRMCKECSSHMYSDVYHEPCPNCKKCKFCTEFEKEYNFPPHIDELFVERYIDFKRFKYPPNLISLVIEYINNDTIFPNLTTLILSKYNGPLTALMFANKLINLKMDIYNMPLPRNVLPNTLKRIELPIYDYPLYRDVFPVGLKVIYLDLFDNVIEPGAFPEDLSSLHMRTYSKELSVGLLPSKLKKLVLGNYNLDINPHVLPDTLISLDMHIYNGKLAYVNDGKVISVLPSNLLYLYMYSYKRMLHKSILPKGLIILELNNYVNHICKNTFPDDLHCLYLESYNGSIKAQTLPPNLKALTLNSYSNIRYEKNPSPNGNKFNFNFENVFPEGLLYLRLDSMFIPPENYHRIPQNILCIEFSYNSFNYYKDKKLPNHFLFYYNRFARVSYGDNLLILIICCKRKKIFMAAELYDYTFIEFFCNF